MIGLSTTAQLLRGTLTAPKTSVDCPWNTTYQDDTFFQTSVGRTSGTTPFTLVPAPTTVGPGIRKVLSILLQNQDTAPVTFAVVYQDGSNTYFIAVFTLQVGETLQYEDGAGWNVLTVNGAIKIGNAPQDSAASSIASSTASQFSASLNSQSTNIASESTAISSLAAGAGGGGATLSAVSTSLAAVSTQQGTDEGTIAADSATASACRSSFGFP